MNRLSSKTKGTAQNRRIEKATKWRFQRSIAAESVYCFRFHPVSTVLFLRAPNSESARLTGRWLRSGCAASQRTKAAAGRLVRTHEGPGRELAPGCARQMPRGPAAAPCAAKLRKNGALPFCNAPVSLYEIAFTHRKGTARYGITTTAGDLLIDPMIIEERLPKPLQLRPS